ESGGALKELQGTIQNCLTALEMSSIQVEGWDSLLVYMISFKLPKVTLSLWEQSLHNKSDIPTWKELDAFLTERYRTLEAIDDVTPAGSVHFQPRSATKSTPQPRLHSSDFRVIPAPRRYLSLTEKYDGLIQEYLGLGHMKVLLPTIFHIMRYLSPRPSANGTSLKDILHAGPVLQSDLTNQILRWRYFQYMFSAEITKMYRQIWVDPKHTPFQRVLFRNKKGDIRYFEFQTVTLGVKCSPFLAIRVLQQIAEDAQRQFPKARRIIKQNRYVDDVLAAWKLASILDPPPQCPKIHPIAGPH
ncbi:hypothetical protein KR038_012118, partial [Drosophila bunnanda]